MDSEQTRRVNLGLTQSTLHISHTPHITDRSPEGRRYAVLPRHRGRTVLEAG